MTLNEGIMAILLEYNKTEYVRGETCVHWGVEAKCLYVRLNKEADTNFSHSPPCYGWCNFPRVLGFGYGSDVNIMETIYWLIKRTTST